jgi:diaminohydroxyphosphoribosylaminopyrimidine deaminase / 5-amino-6-(5-phosphoribosylamino)uracil reductase
MPRSPDRLAPLDHLFLERAYELASRGIGSVSPNPAVGAVVVSQGRIVGEGYHHRAGEPHAEVNALAQAGDAARGATLYVSLEPCNHVGRTPACTNAVLDAGIARVVAGTLDPNPKTDATGMRFLREHGVPVEIADDPKARELIESFARAIRAERPSLSLKMAMSLDGAIASRRGVQEWLTSEAARRFVRELRIEHDAVMVGAGTVRVDDPQLTVRPPYHRLRPYVRVVACETETLPGDRRIFEAVADYERTIVLAPAGIAEQFANLSDIAEVLIVGSSTGVRLDLAEAMKALRACGISSVLCEGGPTLAARLIEAGQVDRFYWVIAPTLLRNDQAVPVLAGANLALLHPRLQFDRIEHVGEDIVISGTVTGV